MKVERRAAGLLPCGSRTKRLGSAGGAGTAHLLSSVLVQPVKVPIMRQPGKPEYHVMTQQKNAERQQDDDVPKIEATKAPSACYCLLFTQT
jgi:hypothetical protein